jgi:T-complex protein 1 subunit gamma
MSVARNILNDPKVVFGAGSLEMHVSRRLSDKAKSVTGVMQQAYQAVALALEVIPRTLASNCGANVVRVLTDLRARHSSADAFYMGIDGVAGTVVDVRAMKAPIVEPAAVKIQALKTAIEAACMILRVDDVVSGTKSADAAEREAKAAVNKSEVDPQDGAEE